MRSESEIREYRDLLRATVALPCCCAAEGHGYKCQMGGMVMSHVAHTITWILGESAPKIDELRLDMKQALAHQNQ